MGEAVKLSRVERVILANQFRILAALYPDEKTDFDGREEVMREGLVGAYDWALNVVVPDVDAMPQEICDEVADILEMYSALRNSYSRIEDKSGIPDDLLTFEGFDVYKEIPHHYYAEFLLHHKGGEFTGLWDERKGIGSLSPKLPGYRAMLTVWRQKNERRDFLTRGDMLDILGAKRSPRCSERDE